MQILKSNPSTYQLLGEVVKSTPQEVLQKVAIAQKSKKIAGRNGFSQVKGWRRINKKIVTSS